MLHWIWVLIVGGVIGLIAGAITHKGGSMNWIANIKYYCWASRLISRRGLAWCLGSASSGNGNCSITLRCYYSSYLGIMDYDDAIWP